MSWSFRTNGNFIDFVHTDNTSLAVENTIVSLHNTSKCVSWITDIDFDGTPMNSQDDFETGIEAMFPGLAGGEGGSGYLSATVELTDAQIKTLPTTIVNLIPAQGAGKLIVPIAAFCVLNATAGAYGTVTDASLSLVLNFDDDFQNAPQVSSPIVTGGYLNDDSRKHFLHFLVPLGNPNVEGTFNGTVSTGEGVNDTYANKPLGIVDIISESETPYTGGNAANTLEVTVYYVVVDL